MRVTDFLEVIGQDFYTGVPDSQLKALCDYLYDTYGIDPKHHIIAANEGNAIGLAAGAYLAFWSLGGEESLVFTMSHSISIRERLPVSC